MKKNTEIAKQILAMLQVANGNISAMGLFRLITITNKIQAPTLVVLHNYTSDKSDNTELADYTLNVGTKYENALESTSKKIEDITVADLPEIQALCTPEKIKGFAYIDRKGLTEEAYCNAVKLALPTAIEEMKTVTPRTNDNVIRINKVLSYNTNTGHLLLSGELVKGGKTVSIVGEIKMTAKAPKTVAKEVVKSFLNTRTSKIRTFVIENLNTISVNGERITLVTA